MVKKPGKHQRCKQRWRFMLEGPWQCTIFWFALDHTLCMNYVTKTFSSVSSVVCSKQLLWFVHGKGLKREQNYTTKNVVEFHNYAPLLTMYISKERNKWQGNLIKTTGIATWLKFPLKKRKMTNLWIDMTWYEELSHAFQIL